MSLVVFDSMGQEMKPGDTMLDFRGERAILRQAKRARSARRKGKILVEWVGEDHQLYECDDSQFDLHVKEV